MKKFIFFVIPFFTVFLVISCKSKPIESKNSKQKSGTIKVEGEIVQPAVLDQIVNVSGTVKPFEETVLMPEVSGRIISIFLPEGGIVKKGTLLVKLFDGDLQAQLNKLKAQLKIAQQTEKRQSELVKVSGVSQSEYDQVVLQINSITADIEIVNVQIQKTEIRAPFDGTIGLRNVSIGAQVTPSTALVTIRDINQLKLDFNVPEKYGKSIKPGLKISFFVQGNETKYFATVLASEQGIDFSTRTLKVRAVVDNTGKILLPGLFANVELHLGDNKKVLLVPSQSIIPQEKSKKIIIAKDGKAKYVTIVTGNRTMTKVEVVSGLKPGDTVITTGIMFLKPNAILQFSKVKRDTL